MFGSNLLSGMGSLFNPLDGNLMGNNVMTGMGAMNAIPDGTFINKGTVGPTMANSGMLDTALGSSFATPSAFENAMYGMAGAGNLLGGVGSLYSAYEANQYMDDQMAMQQDAYRRNVEADEKRQNLNF